MRTRTVGTSGLQVSRLGLGTMAWAHDTAWPEARTLVRRFVDAGGTLIDTAASDAHGEAERWLGRMVAGDVSRDDLVIATKAGFSVRDGAGVVDTSRAALLADLGESLKRLRTDHVDLWQLHAWGDSPLEESLAAMDHAVSSGMARYVGISNFVGWQTAQAATWQRAFPGRAPIVSTQVEYSLLARRAEIEVLPAARAFGTGLFAWSPLGRGVLSAKYRTGIPRDSRGASPHFRSFVETYWDDRSRSVVEAVRTAADGLGLSPVQVALLWVRDAPGVTAPLLGPRTAEQLEHLLETEEDVLPAAIVAALDDVSGGPNVGRGEEETQ
ncbi:aldo/keto reductase [Propionicicella superfundia]|uniref:aldo/keto reductase n=1 Tax=Propionicicella superfundia TaxID=348582 RepID=UPI0003F52078|nr:aldo/keto reductase [Propionicicella superfundia]